MSLQQTIAHSPDLDTSDPYAQCLNRSETPEHKARSLKPEITKASRISALKGKPQQGRAQPESLTPTQVSKNGPAPKSLTLDPHPISPKP